MEEEEEEDDEEAEESLLDADAVVDEVLDGSVGASTKLAFSASAAILPQLRKILISVILMLFCLSRFSSDSISFLFSRCSRMKARASTPKTEASARRRRHESRSAVRTNRDNEPAEGRRVMDGKKESCFSAKIKISS